MRKKSSHFLTRGAFSLIELVSVILILGIISHHAFPRFFVQEHLCIQELRAKLSKANAEFTKLYEQSILQNKMPNIQNILQDLTSSQNPSCVFKHTKQKLIAHIGNKTLSFAIDPKDFSTKPKVYCKLSDNLCQNFWGKKLKK